MSISAIGDVAALVLTLFVFTYLLGDFFPQRVANLVMTPYRLAVYIFAGLSAGFVAIITFDSALNPWLDTLQTGGGPLVFALRIVPLVLALGLLLPNFPPRLELLNLFKRLALAFLIGAGAAIALVGAVSGTIIPLTVETGQSVGEGLFVGAVMLIGVITTLMYFQYSARRRDDGEIQQNILVRLLRGVGGIFIAIVFGSFYAAAINSTLVVFSERLRFLLMQIFGG